LEEFAKKESKNYSRNIFVLKCDVKQFFYSIDQQLLWDLIKARIKDGQTLDLIKKIIRSFETSPGKGLPLGNVTSQLFANIYLNELDQFVKHVLQEKFYIRYCDDFIFLHEDKKYLEKLKNIICQFVENKLHLTIHPDKIFLQKFRQGLDFLGYVLLPHYRVLRTKTKQRMFKKIKKKVEEFNDNLITDFDLNQSVQSYLGMLTHCQGYNLETKLKNRCGLGVVAEEKIC